MYSNNKQKISKLFIRSWLRLRRPNNSCRSNRLKIDKEFKGRNKDRNIRKKEKEKNSNIRSSNKRKQKQKNKSNRKRNQLKNKLPSLVKSQKVLQSRLSKNKNRSQLLKSNSQPQKHTKMLKRDSTSLQLCFCKKMQKKSQTKRKKTTSKTTPTFWRR